MTMADIKAKAVNSGRQILYKARNIKDRAVDAGRKGVKWVVDNPDKAAGAAAGAAALLGGANKLVRSVNRNVVMRRELRDKRHRVYDHSLGAFVYTKRPISKKDVEKIYAERRRTGKRVCEIMADKGMLKK